MTKFYKAHESGRSMVEIVGVLGVMGLISIGAFVLIRSGMTNQKRTMVMDDVASIVTGVHALFADYDDYGKMGTSCNAGKGENILAAIGVGSAGPYENVSYSICRTSDKKQFKVGVNNLSESDCSVLASKAWTGGIVTNNCSNSNHQIIVTYN